MPRWKIAEPGTFDSLPEPTKPKVEDPEWKDILDALEAGQEVELPYEIDPQHPEKNPMRGLRLAVGRRAAGRQFKVNIRYGDGYLVARKSQDAYIPKQAPAVAAPPAGNSRRNRGRPRKQDRQSTMGDGGTYAQNEAAAEGFE